MVFFFKKCSDGYNYNCNYYPEIKNSPWWGVTNDSLFTLYSYVKESRGNVSFERPKSHYNALYHKHLFPLKSPHLS